MSHPSLRPFFMTVLVVAVVLLHPVAKVSPFAATAAPSAISIPSIAGARCAAANADNPGGPSISGVRVVKATEAESRLRKKLDGPMGPHLRRAFDLFERRFGVRPDINAAWGVTGPGLKASVRTTVQLLPASLKLKPVAQDFSFADGTTDLYYIPGDSETDYWSGTFDGSTCDSGQCAEAIINVQQQWSDGVWVTTWEQLTYTDDDRGTHHWVRNDGTPQDPIVLASFNQQNGFSIRPVGLRALGKYADYLGCGASRCAGMAAGCGLAHLWNAEMAWAPCTGAGCVGGFIACTWGNLWGWQ
jgi:hypothetical protein